MALVILSIVSLFIGVIDTDPGAFLTGNPETVKLFLISRVPRLLAILCTGIGLSTAGLIMQQLCMNRFVSPSTGATISSAQLGILLALVFLPNSSLWGRAAFAFVAAILGTWIFVWFIQHIATISSAQLGILLALVFLPNSSLWGRAAFAFVAAILGTWIFVWFIQHIQFKDVVLVPLVGIMFGNVIGGITNFIAYKYEMTQALSTWLVGHFSMVLRGRYEIVYMAVPLVILAFVFANHFNIVGMGKDFSKNLGVPYNFILFMGITIAAMITASVIVVVGSVSYIGLIVPNIVAMFKGDKIRGTLIDTALFGALFVLVCDMIGRVVIMPYELPIELIIGTVGSVLFVILLLYRLKNGRKAVRFGKGGIGNGQCGA